MARRYCYDYPRPALTVDLAVFARGPSGFRILMIQRKKSPFEGCWALPGGFVDPDERIEAAASRELAEETGLTIRQPLEFLGIWDDPRRDPRGRVISVAYVTALSGSAVKVAAGDDAEAADWVDPRAIGPLAFDHDEMLQSAWHRLVNAILGGSWTPRFLPREFNAQDVDTLFRLLWIGPRRRSEAVKSYLAGHAAPIPGKRGYHRARTRRTR